MARTYESPAAFKQALEQRLRMRAAKVTLLARTRQLLVFDRFLARIVSEFGDAATLKGGVALELRIDAARTTKDIDLRLMGSSNDVLGRLQAAARLDLRDFLTFEIVPDARHPEIEADGMKYDGLRFRAQCSLAGKIYGQRFGVDIAFGDPIFGESETVIADDVLGFAGIAPPTLRLYPLETHVAEKLMRLRCRGSVPTLASRISLTWDCWPEVASSMQRGYGARWLRRSRSGTHTSFRPRCPNRRPPGSGPMLRLRTPTSSPGRPLKTCSLPHAGSLTLSSGARRSCPGIPRRGPGREPDDGAAQHRLVL